MKFQLHQSWRHRLCLDVFFYVTSVAINGESTILTGAWCTQDVYDWRMTKSACIMVAPHEYDSWLVYEPKGKMRL